MFDIGFTELLVIAVLGLLILGPERMPGAIRTLGLWVGRIRRQIGGIQKEIEQELRTEELKETLKNPLARFDQDQTPTQSDTDNRTTAEQPKADPDSHKS